MDLRDTIIERVLSTLRRFSVQQEVEEAVQDVLTMELGKYEVQERTTELAVYDNSAEGMLRRFVATKRIEGKADTTLRRYYSMNMELLHFLGKPLYDVTTYDIRFYLSWRRQKGKVTNRTLDGMRRCYSVFFAWLAAEGLISHNPCAAVAQIKYKKQVKKPFTRSELNKLRGACNSVRDLALVEFLYATGCRVSEVATLDIRDVDFKRRECIVLGKGNKERRVYFTPVTAELLEEYLSSRKDEHKALFIGRGSSRLGKNGIEAALKRIGKRADVENVHPHRYRRTLATNLLNRGMRIQDVAAILGHEDLKTTQIYVTMDQSRVRRAYQRYAAA